MQVVQKDLMDMLVKELKEELEARDQTEGDQRPRPATRHGCAVEAARAIVRARILHESHIGNTETFTVL